jgi:hypothetical protein
LIIIIFTKTTQIFSGDKIFADIKVYMLEGVLNRAIHKNKGPTVCLSARGCRSKQCRRQDRLCDGLAFIFWQYTYLIFCDRF